MRKFTAVFAAAIFAAVLISSAAFAETEDRYDPPSRAARLSYLRGDVSVQPGGEDKWVWASTSRPLTTGDELWTEKRARAELKLGSTALRLADKTSLSLLNIDDNSAQVGLNSGVLIVRIRYLAKGDYFEIDTPNVAVSLLKAGDYRIEADESGDYTSVQVRSGRAEVSGSDEAFRVEAGSEAEISGAYRTSYEVYDLPPSDEFDRWSRKRDFQLSHSRSLKYVSAEVTGYEDLDRYGGWTSDSTYGNVWAPSRVDADWSPYRDGRWAWVEPWGWTWMDDQPWGYATSHYGRWAYASHRWVWVPPRYATHDVYYRPTYSPANVVFVNNTTIINNYQPVVAWFPLAPGEAYVPSYRCSRNYVRRLNETNTVVRGSYPYNYGGYERRRITQQDYTNAVIAGAVVALATEAFTSSHHAGHNAVRVRSDAIMAKEAAYTAPVAPAREAVLVSSEPRPPAATSTEPPAPPAKVSKRQVVGRQAPPPPRVPFSRKQRLLEQNAGKPLDPEAEQKLSVETKATAEPPPVKTVAPDVAATPVEAVEKKERRADDRHHRRIEAPAVPEETTAAGQAAPAEQPLTPKEQAEMRREEEQQQREEAKQKAEEERRLEQQQRETDRQKAEQDRQQQEQQRAADRQKAEEERRQQQEEQRAAARQKAEEERQQQEQQRAAEREAEKQKAEEARQQREEAKQRAEAERQQREQERNAARQQEEEQPQSAATSPEEKAQPQGRKPHGPQTTHRRHGQEEPAQEEPAQEAPQPDPDQKSEAAPSGPVQVDAAAQEQKLISQPPLRYPHEAEKAGVEGTVKLQTVIGPDGRVKDATVVDGPAELQKAAKDNVARRKYAPTVVDGKPVEVQTEVSVDFEKQ